MSLVQKSGTSTTQCTTDDIKMHTIPRAYLVESMVTDDYSNAIPSNTCKAMSVLLMD